MCNKCKLQCTVHNPYNIIHVLHVYAYNRAIHVRLLRYNGGTHLQCQSATVFNAASLLGQHWAEGKDIDQPVLH